MLAVCFGNHVTCPQSLFRFEPGCANEVGPEFNFSPDAGGEFLRGACDGFKADRNQPLLHFRQRDSAGDLVMQQTDDLLGVPVGTSTPTQLSPFTCG